MSQTIIPFDKCKDIVENYLPKVGVKSQLIYSIILTAVIGIGASLPFIFVDVSTTATGQIQAGIEKQDILIPASGYISQIDIKENTYVHKGSRLLLIDESTLNSQESIHSGKQAQYQALYEDVNRLLHGDTIPATSYYKISYIQYQEQLTDALTKLQKSKIDLDRSKQLLSEKVIAASEFENVQLSYNQALSAYNMIMKKQKSTWEAEALNYLEQIRTSQSNRLQLSEDKKKYIVSASINGNIQQLQGYQIGSYVAAGQKIGEITPDTNLIVQCFIMPSKIGYVKKGQLVHIQVDAFNYNEWGMLRGKVLDVSQDIVVINQQPVFKVRCQLEQNFLQLKNGYKGILQKGMSVRTRFVLTRRSLFQLLYDKMDNWMNPVLAS